MSVGGLIHQGAQAAATTLAAVTMGLSTPPENPHRHAGAVLPVAAEKSWTDHSRDAIHAIAINYTDPEFAASLKNLTIHNPPAGAFTVQAPAQVAGNYATPQSASMKNFSASMGLKTPNA